jgi:hypothetical protein
MISPRGLRSKYLQEKSRLRDVKQTRSSTGVRGQDDFREHADPCGAVYFLESVSIVYSAALSVAELCTFTVSPLVSLP